MAIFDTVAFPTPDPVTGPPTIDGWTGNADPGMQSSFAEPGYATGGRITFGGGALAPVAVFECVQMTVEETSPPGPVAPGDYLALGFFCTFDYTFDDGDGVTIAFIPDLTKRTDYTTHRRIDVLPFMDGVGAGTSSQMVDDPPLPDTDTGFQMRYQRSIVNYQMWMGAGTSPGAKGSWKTVAFQNVYGEAASWVPSSVTAHAVGQTLPGPGTTFAFNVDDTSSFPASGEFVVGSNTVGYTGIASATQFIGCTVVAGTGGTVAAGAAVELQDRSWSFELLVPISSALGGSNWLDLQPEFGLYINLFKFSKTAPAGTPLNQGFYAVQYRFPLPDPSAMDQQLITGNLSQATPIDESWYGTAVLPTFTGTNPAVGVCFSDEANPVNSIGVEHPPQTGLTNQINVSNSTANNVLVANIQNTDPTNEFDNVTAEFRFADWGMPPAMFGNWDPASAHGAAPPNELNLKPAGQAGASGSIQSDWAENKVPAAYATSNGGHHCIWVQLDSTSTVNFVQDGVRANMNFYQLSEASGTATISGQGYPPPVTGKHHQFVLLPHIRRIPPAPVFEVDTEEPQATQELTQNYVWLVEGLLRTKKTMTVKKRTAEVLIPAGEFGALASHVGAASDIFVQQLSGGGVVPSGRGYHVSVPHGGRVVARTNLAAGPAKQFHRPPLPEPIKEGARGEAVSRAQFLLSVEGYGVGATQIDGIFGASTAAVVAGFQRANDLRSTGAVDTETWAALFALAPVPVPVFPPELQSGETGSMVGQLQNALDLAKSAFASWAPALAVNDHFDPQTERLVAALQEWSHLAPNAVVGYRTWAASSGPTLWDEVGVHAPGAPGGAHPTVHQGSRGLPAQHAQFLLSAEGFGLAPWQVDGNFGPASREAVQRFQKYHHLHVDGIVGPRVWKALIANAPARHRPLPPILQVGSTGAVVRLLQETLNNATARFGLTHSRLAVDGHFGPATASLVKEFQAWGAVIIDGIVSYRTWSVPIGPSLWSL